MALKVATWNIEHADKLVTENPTPNILDRRQRIRETIKDIDPDILCMEEGPKGEKAILDFSDQVLGGQWVPIMLRQPGEALGLRDNDYLIKGDQWIWFLVRAGLKDRCQLQHPSKWQELTKAEEWPVHLWGEEVPVLHSHYRHPQVLTYDLGNNQKLELIGVHLKSKINQETITWDANNNLVGPYLKEALEARIELATEARNIRQYIAGKFEKLSKPAILVMGDCNDGPGQDLFETQYLFFDLISNLQGDVVLAERFFNHALFDFPEDLRWSAKYADEISHLPPSKNPLLLDHILISQPLCLGGLSLVANAHAGKVEHDAWNQHNVGASDATRTSDHRPVSCRLDDVV